MEHINKNYYRSIIILSILLLFLLAGCDHTQTDENVSAYPEENTQSTENIDANMTEEIKEQTTETTKVVTENGYEGEWYRTDVASYQWARITISNWKEGESFDVTVWANYGQYGDLVKGTATFIGEDMAVLHDEMVEDFLKNHEGDHGIYFQFLGDSIIVTHDIEVRMWFGGGGITTAEGTYIQGEPEYTNCTDVGEIFTEDELEAIQELLGDSYGPLFKNVIELGEIKEYDIDNGRLWEAHIPPYGEWCNILIYDDGRIYVEGCSYADEAKGFYTNSKDTEMPDVELLKNEL